MLKLIKRCEEFVEGYREYCQELHDNKVTFFVPTNPNQIDKEWYHRTKQWYDKKECGDIKDQPTGFHYWAIDENKFIGELQIRTVFTDKVMNDIGSIGYAVRISEQGRRYGTEIFKQGLGLAKNLGLKKVLVNINEENVVSIHICEKLGGNFMDKIHSYNEFEGEHVMCRYWIST